MREKLLVGFGVVGMALLLGCGGGGGTESTGTDGPSSAAECASIWGSVPCSQVEGVAFQFRHSSSGCESFDFYYRNPSGSLTCEHPGGPVLFGDCGGGGIIEASILAKWPNESTYDILVAAAGAWPPFGQWTVTISDPCAVQTFDFDQSSKFQER